MTHTDNRGPNRGPNRSNAGFTLPEVLLAGTLGSLLLMSLAATTTTFTETLHDLEVKAGIAVDENSVLGHLTRDIREAWTAATPSINELKLFDTEGEVTRWFVDGGDLVVVKPNGDTDSVIQDVNAIYFDPTWETRRREGEPATAEASWYSKGALTSPSAPMALESGDALALAFSVPVDDVAIGGIGKEQILSAQAGIISLPVAWGTPAGLSAGDLSIKLFQTRGPGSGTPYGSALGAVTLAGDALPAAADDGSGNWDAPSGDVAISLSSMGVSLEPGNGYAVVLRPSGDGELVLKSHVIFGSADDDDTSLSTGGAFATQARRVPFSLSGSVNSTTTVATQEITRISITLVPDGRPVQTRSAALLNQVLSDDPWLGSVSGEAPPTTVGAGIGSSGDGTPDGGGGGPTPAGF